MKQIVVGAVLAKRLCYQQIFERQTPPPPNESASVSNASDIIGECEYPDTERIGIERSLGWERLAEEKRGRSVVAEPECLGAVPRSC